MFLLLKSFSKTVMQYRRSFGYDNEPICVFPFIADELFQEVMHRTSFDEQHEGICVFRFFMSFSKKELVTHEVNIEKFEYCSDAEVLISDSIFPFLLLRVYHTYFLLSQVQSTTPTPLAQH